MFCGESLFEEPRRSISNLRFVQLDSPTPLFRWETFPSSIAIPSEGGAVLPLTNLRYELKLLEVSESALSGFDSAGVLEGFPDVTPIVVENLTVPEHRFTRALKACTEYLWTVRARFELFGRTRFTEWAGVYSLAGLETTPGKLRQGRSTTVHNPAWYYFPVRTACDSD